MAAAYRQHPLEKKNRSAGWQSIRAFGKFIALAAVLVSAAPALSFVFDTSEDSRELLLGYGQSFPGWGLTTERVHTLDIVPRYTHQMFHLFSGTWWQGRYATMVELPVQIVLDPDTSAMLGINFLARYTFTASQQWQPYIFGGGGPLYSFADIPGMGAELNGNYQFAGGVAYQLTPERTVCTELRYHHISNGGSEEPNVPLNALKFFIGISF